MQLLQLRSGLDPDLLHERGAACRYASSASAWRPQRYSASMPLRVEALAERVLGQQRLDLAHDLLVAARGQVRVDRQFGGGQAQLLQPADLRAPRTAPRRCPRAARRDSARAWRAASPDAPRVASPTSRSKRSASISVPVDLQLVAAPARDDLGVAAVGEHLAQPPDVVLDHLARARRRLLTPQALDQPVRADEPVGLQASIASTARCFEPPSATGRSSALASTDPSRRISIRRRTSNCSSTINPIISCPFGQPTLL